MIGPNHVETGNGVKDWLSNWLIDVGIELRQEIAIHNCRRWVWFHTKISAETCFSQIIQQFTL